MTPAPIVLIRDMTDADAAAVLAIYAEGIATSHATFEVDVPTWERFSASRHKAPRLVAEIGGLGGVLARVGPACVQRRGRAFGLCRRHSARDGRWPFAAVDLSG